MATWLRMSGLVVCFLAALHPGRGEPAKSPGDINLIWAANIPMRDEVKLNATVYQPKDMKDPLPVIFTLTPYISDNYHERALYFARNGYIFAIVDARGRGNSEGKFAPMENEGRDGHDIVEWLAKQKWCNGKVAMWGGSYAGYDQWATLKEFPPHLATVVPAASACPGADVPAFKNVFASYLIQWMTLVSGKTGNQKLFGESTFWIQKYRELYLQHRPYQELDTVVGNPSEHFQKWLKHPIPDEFWDAMIPSVKDYEKIKIPILSITGHYDDDQAGAMEYYRMHMKHGSAETKAKHFLIAGPWDHAGTRTPKAEVGGMKFGDASLVDLNQLHKEWYDWTMKDGKKPGFLKKRVGYYLAGAEEWKYADSLDAIGSDKLMYYLTSAGGKANDVFRSGTLSKEMPEESKPDRYTYDPLDVRPAELEREEIKNWITDQRRALNLFGSGLAYHSEPFGEDTELTGYLKLTLWIELDVQDTDFEANVYEIQPDGGSVLLTNDYVRARYRDSLRQEKLVKPGEINRYDFTGFNFFSRRIAKGSRLRLVVRAPNSIHVQKNFNGGGVVAEESKKDARTAHVVLHHDAEHPSALEIPNVRKTAK